MQNNLMDYNSFDYRSYVELNYRYNPAQWPSNVALAELHSRCTMPGELTENGVSCPCCGEHTKISNTPYVRRSIYPDFRQTSSGICGHFLLLRSMVLVSFILVLLGSIYQLIVQYGYCYHNGRGLCYTLTFLQFIDYRSLIDANHSLGAVLSCLAIAMYVVLLIANILILRGLLHIKSSCDGMFTHNTLLVSNMDQQRLTELIDTGGVAADQFDTVELENIYDEFNLRRKCKKLFFEIQAVRAMQFKLNKLNKLNGLLRKKVASLYEHNNDPPTSFLITFRHEQQAHKVEACFHKNGVFSEYLKYPEDIRWEHAGQNLVRCRYILSQVWILCEILVVALLLCIPVLIDLRLDAISFTQLTIGQFIACYGLSILVSIASMFVTMLVEMNCKDLKTHSTVAERVFFYNTLFSLILYITLPLIFTLLGLVRPGVGIYVVVEQAAIIIVVQVIVSIVDPKYYVWRTRRSLLLGDSFQSLKYDQRRLHHMVKCIEYPLLDKLLVVMRICSYAFGFSFVSPYIPVVLFVCLLIIFIFEKRNIYKHYRPAELNISVILYAFAYSSIASEGIMCIFLSAYLILEYEAPYWVLAITIPLLIPAWWIKIRMYRNRYGVRKPEQSIELSAMESPGLQGGMRISKLKSIAENQSYRKRYEGFIDRMRNKQLFESIDSYLRYIS